MDGHFNERSERMSTSAVRHEAAHIVARAAFSALELNGTIVDHIPHAYEVWRSEHQRTGIDSSARDEFRYSVLVALGTLGFSF
jgi:hypothetical protein